MAQTRWDVYSEIKTVVLLVLITIFIMMDKSDNGKRQF